LIQATVDLLRKANVKITNNKGDQVYFSRRSLASWLKETERFHRFRKLLTSWVLAEDSDAASWMVQVEIMKSLLELDELNDEAIEFLEYDAVDQAENGGRVPASNIYTCANGQEVEVGTIHSVKGETHDATLVLETQYHQNDLQRMLPYLIDASMGQPTTIRDIEFMRKIYVAASRPQHLLCLAIHADHINAEQTTAMLGLGWSVIDLVGAGEHGE